MLRAMLPAITMTGIHQATIGIHQYILLAIPHGTATDHGTIHTTMIHSIAALDMDAMVLAMDGDSAMVWAMVMELMDMEAMGAMDMVADMAYTEVVFMIMGIETGQLHPLS